MQTAACIKYIELNQTRKNLYFSVSLLLANYKFYFTTENILPGILHRFNDGGKTYEISCPFT